MQRRHEAVTGGDREASEGVSSKQNDGSRTLITTGSNSLFDLEITAVARSLAESTND